MDTRILPLASGAIAVIDAEDANRCAKYSWSLVSTGGRHNKYYAHAEVEGVKVRLHHFILGKPPEGKLIDHKNGITLDCRRSNMRVCTPTENARNRTVSSRNKLGYKGVSIDKSGKYAARIMIDKKRVHLGLHDTPEQAASAYKKAAEEHFGEYVCL
jgi:hypothetical protein